MSTSPPPTGARTGRLAGAWRWLAARLWRDTLARRLFLLMWGALVFSHLAAWWLVTQGIGLHRGRPPAPPPPAVADASAPPASAAPRTPTFPSLPPTPGLPGDRPGPRGPGPGGPGPEPGAAPPGSPGAPPWAGPPQGPPGAAWRPPPPPPSGSGGLPTPMLLLDYGVRALLIALAAWWGARWLAAPMQRLVRASQALARGVGGAQAPEPLPSRGATAEVREASEVFNQMAQQLHGQFRSRGLLMAALSHDLRTPLTRMRIRLEALKDEPSVGRCIDDIREMDTLIDHALQAFRDSGSDEAPQRTDVAALVQSMVDDLQEQGHAVEAHTEPVVGAVRVVALRRVLQNLVGNALRYGGSAELRLCGQAGGVQIDISDRGPGIPEADLAHVFEPFYRVETSRSRHGGGTGLGLYIARDLVQRQGGTLVLRNRPAAAGGGLCASLWWPWPA